MNERPMIKRALLTAMVVLCGTMAASADTFGTGGNEFDIDFVPISSATNPISWVGYGVVDYDYRMGVYEITNGQWDKFQAELGLPVTGDPADAYDEPSLFAAPDVPVNCISWYEAAQFVNWLNTSAGHQAAYKFTGTQGTGDYTMESWSPAEAAGGANLYRHKDAVYFLPDQDEWVKAAYASGTDLWSYATKEGEFLHQGDGLSGTGWNFWNEDDLYATDPPGPWDVGSGSEELNGTFDMMGNVWEWLESPYDNPDFDADSLRVLRGGSYAQSPTWTLSVYGQAYAPPYDETGFASGFRVAAAVPEPASVGLLLLGFTTLLRRRKR